MEVIRAMGLLLVPFLFTVPFCSATQGLFPGTCQECRYHMLHTSESKRLKDSWKIVAGALQYVCNTLYIKDNEICMAVKVKYEDAVNHVMRKLLLNPDRFCAAFAVDCDPEGRSSWSVKIPGNKPPLRERWVPPNNVYFGRRLRFLHLSDIHVDPEYQEGSEAACPHELCCRADPLLPNKYVNIKAGRWGTVAKCDMPNRTVEHMLAHIARTEPDIEHILWTGDVPAHDTWNADRKLHLEMLDGIAKAFKRHFPKAIVYSALGNHEGVPSDTFPSQDQAPPGTKYSNDWLYNFLADSWTELKLPECTKAVIKRRASYSVALEKNMRIISINTMPCDLHNMWLLLNGTDPDGVLQWLADELYKAEKIGEAVFIIGHIPPADNSCVRGWSRNYYDIVNRFEGTIRGQFFGHTHYDSFSVFYDTSGNKRRPTNVMFATPSVTTWQRMWPAYRIYEIDGLREEATYEIMDHVTHLINLPMRADLEPYYEEEYQASRAYGLQSLLPSSLDALIERFRNDDDAFDIYNNFYTHGGSRTCVSLFSRHKCLCEMRSARSYAKDEFCSDL